MTSNVIANSLSLTLFLVSLIIVVRSFSLYVRSRSRRLLILGVSMLIIALTALVGVVSDNETSLTLNVNWFVYLGQFVSFLFILLSILGKSERALRHLTRWYMIASPLLLIPLLMAPFLPATFPASSFTQSLLSGSRGVVCLIICIIYFSTFLKKETRFPLLMSGAFVLISFGYLIILPKYFQPNETLDHVGDILRITGLLTLLAAILRGDPAHAPDEKTLRSARASLLRRQSPNKEPLL